MRKAVKRTLVFVLAAAMLVLAACQTGGAPPSAQPQGGSEAVAPSGAGGETIRIAMIPQIKGIDYFNACKTGAEEAAAELGIEFIYDGPTDGRVDRQIELINTLIADQVDAILVSPNDSDTIVPVLQAAMEAGIKVLTFDVDANNDARDFFVNPADADLIGKALIETMVGEVGGSDFEYVILCESLADAGQKSWTDAAKAYADANYPDLQFLEIKQTTSSQEQAYAVTKDLLKVYPDLKGIVTVGAMVFPGAIEAVNDAGLKGEISIQGMGTPLEIKAFVEDGSIQHNILWNPIDLGYVAVMAAYDYINGDLQQGQETHSFGRVGELNINGKEIMLGDPFIFDKDNIGDFNF